MTALDRVLDSLERRMDRRLKRLKRAEDAMVAPVQRGEKADQRVKASYLSEAARYDEARLAYNAAVRIVEESGHV